MSHFVITGHTGFKGAWLSLLLKSAGHKVSGISLDEPSGGLFVASGLGELLENDLRIDIRDREGLLKATRNAMPDYFMHLAAQSIVSKGYSAPELTYETNVLGTLNALDAVTLTPSIRAAVFVTSDKVYRNTEAGEIFVEDSPLGGDDPYSASKAMSELLIREHSIRNSRVPVGVARAGNVIGYGDVAEGRLFPDILRSISLSQTLEVRHPSATRPWQHVLDCLNGYLKLLSYTEHSGRPAVFNFGPTAAENVSVQEILKHAQSVFGSNLNYQQLPTAAFPEKMSLRLDSRKARQVLDWQEIFELDETIREALTPLAQEKDAVRKFANDRISRLKNDAQSSFLLH